MAYYPLQTLCKPSTHDLYFEQCVFDELSPGDDGNDMERTGFHIPGETNVHYNLGLNPMNSAWDGLHNQSLGHWLREPRTTFFSINTMQRSPSNCCPQNTFQIDHFFPGCQGGNATTLSQYPSTPEGDSLSTPTDSSLHPSTPEDSSTTSFLPVAHHYSDHSDTWEPSQTHSHILAGVGGIPEKHYISPLEIDGTRQGFDAESSTTRASSSIPDVQVPLGLPDHISQAVIKTLDYSDVAKELCLKEELHDNKLGVSDYPEPDTEGHLGHEKQFGYEQVGLKRKSQDQDSEPKVSRKRGRKSDPRSSVEKSKSRRTPNGKRSKTSPNTAKDVDNLSSIADHSARRDFSCAECNQAYRDEGALQRHKNAKHTRPFICVFSFAGCSSSFPSKNEWKRHVITQHLALHYWLCTQDGCGHCLSPLIHSRTPQSKLAASSSSASSLPNGAIFNRKDLYTQHVRRMHMPPGVTKYLQEKTPVPAWEGQLRQLQVDAERRRCELPTQVRCPVSSCALQFRGINAWDDRMEHVAKHLEAAAEGREAAVCFGGEQDQTLTQWASSPEVGVIRKTLDGCWELINPLRGDVGPLAGNAKGTKRMTRSFGPKSRGGGIDEEIDADGESE